MRQNFDELVLSPGLPAASRARTTASHSRGVRFTLQPGFFQLAFILEDSSVLYGPSNQHGVLGAH